MIHCLLHCHSNSAHVSNLLTRFNLFWKAGAVPLAQECIIDNAYDMTKPQHLRDAKFAHLLVVMNGSIRLYYDNHDSDEIDGDVSEGVGCYFR